MSQIIFRDFYCEKCYLQFDKKNVYNQHLTLVHGEKIKMATYNLIKRMCITNI